VKGSVPILLIAVGAGVWLAIILIVLRFFGVNLS
jgi:hypothetical protein